MKGGESEGKPNLFREQGTLSVLRVGAISSPAYISYEWPNVAPIHHSINTHLPAATDRLHLDVGHNWQSHFHQSFKPSLQEMVEDHDKHWMSEEELEAHAISGMDDNQYFGRGGMYWNPSDHPATSFSRPPSLCSYDSSWSRREADMNRAVDMVAFSSSYSTNGLTSPSAASFCSPFDSLGSTALGFVMPGSEISGKMLHSSSTMTDAAEESVSGSMSNISGDGEVKAVDSLPYPILRPIIIPNMSRDRSRADFKRTYDHKTLVFLQNTGTTLG